VLELMRGPKFRPMPGQGREPMPAPCGEVIYDALKTSFVDFTRLLVTLHRQRFTGYVRLLTDDATALTFLRAESCSDASSMPDPVPCFAAMTPLIGSALR
jgi:hypothetical protein